MATAKKNKEMIGKWISSFFVNDLYNKINKIKKETTTANGMT